jgi:hypothetical protein
VPGLRATKRYFYMLDTFREFFETHRAEIQECGIRMAISPPVHGFGPDAVCVDIRSVRFDLAIRFWENGMCDSDFVSWNDMDRGVETVHFEFDSVAELQSFLASVLRQICSASVLETFGITIENR